MTASLETALAQRDALEQVLAEQEPAYDVLEARLAEVMALLNDCSAKRDNLGAELARLQRVVRENNECFDWGWGNRVLSGCIGFLGGFSSFKSV